ncbi:MAG: TRAM domain-containing protein [Nanobdellota archaeon]
MYGNNEGFAPVKEGEQLDVKIEAVGEKGDGIAKKDGFVIFVPDTNEGDEVKIKVTKVLKKVGFGEKVGESESSESQDEQEESNEEPEEAPEDSEDFGEEDSEEPKE